MLAAYSYSSSVESDKSETVDNPLHEAAKRGNLPMVLECLANRVSVNGLDKVTHAVFPLHPLLMCCVKSGSTALHWAARCGHEECVGALLDAPGIEINVQNKIGDTPLHSAAWKGSPSVVSLLLEKGRCARIEVKCCVADQVCRCRSQHQEL